jgi:hypothetical protein
MYAQIRLDAWNGSKWIPGYRWGPLVSGTINGYPWSPGGQYWTFPYYTFENLLPGYYTVQIDYGWYTSNKLVGEAWFAPEKGDMGLILDGLAPEAWVGNTAPGAAGWCALPQ